MSALARYFHAKGKKVYGYDRTSTPLTDDLRNEGIDIHFEDNVDLIPDAIRHCDDKSKVLVVLTPAIPKDHKEWSWFRHNGFEIAKRSQVLGILTAGEKTLGVAGTHGKTTTSSLLAHILHHCGVNCTAFLGGISLNFGSNLLIGRPDTPGHCIVVEADEFDRSFLTLYPEMAVITSMDADHLDIYGDANHMQDTYRAFASQVKPDGILFVKKGLPVTRTAGGFMTYSITDGEAQYRAENIRVEAGVYVFDLITPGYAIEGIKLGLPGRHNVENAIAASAIAIECGVDPGMLVEALAQYKGVQRRFEYHVRTTDCVYIDDYAHHPEELRAAILSIRELYPDKIITGVFQPHLYTRTRDFAEGFAASLSLLDELYMLEIYPARELPIPGVSSSMILDNVQVPTKKLVSKEGLIAELRTNRPEVLVTLGAGDIDQLVRPIATLLTTTT